MNKSGFLAILIFSTTLLILISSIKCLPVPADEKEDDDKPKTSTTTTTTSSTTAATSPSLRIIPDEPTTKSSKETEAEESKKSENSVDSDSKDTNDELDGSESKQKREQQLPSQSDLESRREEFIKSLGGGGEGSAVLTSLMGLGSLATDAVELLSTNANETFAPLRDARKRARENFPDFGTNLNRILMNGREYTGRAYRGIVKNLRVKLTNTLRFMLQAVTRLASTVGGLYQVLVSVLDVATRGISRGAPFVSRFLSSGSTAAVRGLAVGSEIVRNVAQSGALTKPINQAVMVGRGLAKGLSEDLFDKVEWAQEGINSKLELAQALAPNFLLRAHENTNAPAEDVSSSTTEGSYRPPDNDDTISIDGGGGDGDGGGGSSDNGGYSKFDDVDDTDQALLGLSSSSVEKMMRDGRGIDKEMMMKIKEMMSSSTTTTTEESNKESDDKSTTEVNQSLLDDIFGLQGEVDKIKSTTVKSKKDDLREDDDKKKT